VSEIICWQIGALIVSAGIKVIKEGLRNIKIIEIQAIAGNATA
jgi:hypothetical protein